MHFINSYAIPIIFGITLGAEMGVFVSFKG